MDKHSTRKNKPFLGFHNMIFLSHLAIIIITLILFLLVNFYRASADSEKNSVYSAGQTVSQTLEYMEYMVNSTNRAMEQLVFNAQIQNVFNRNTVDYAQNKLQQVEDANKLSNLFYSMTTYPISNIRLYIPDAVGLSQENVNFYGLNNAMESNWYERIKDTRRSIWLPSRFLDSGESHKISIARKIISDTDYNKTLGVIQLEIPQSVFNGLLNKVKFTQNSSSLLFNSREEIISTSSDNFWDNSKNYSLLHDSFPNDSYETLVWQKVALEKQDYLIGIQNVKSTDWKIALAIPWSDIMQPYTNTRNNMIIIVLFVIPLSFILSYLFTHASTKKIRQLITHMRKVVKRDFNVEILPASNGEIGELIQNYNYMITKVSTLLEEKYTLGHQVKNLELKSLQAQINPHFLYNTLDLINWMSTDVNAPMISDLVQTLSKFYRLSLSMGEEVVTLQNELEHIRSYVKIQNMRFNDGITLVIDVSPSFYNCSFLKLTLQPIIENAILHGILEKKDESGSIHITACPEGEDLIVSVIDDGVGIPEDILKLLLTKSQVSKTGGFGVKNIHERIRLAYGEKYGLTYESAPGEGTTVRIKIPNRLYPI